MADSHSCHPYTPSTSYGMLPQISLNFIDSSDSFTQDSIFNLRNMASQGTSLDSGYIAPLQAPAHNFMKAQQSYGPCTSTTSQRTAQNDPPKFWQPMASKQFQPPQASKQAKSPMPYKQLKIPKRSKYPMTAINMQTKSNHISS